MLTVSNLLRGIRSADSLPEPQRRMYAAETTDNFRWVAKLFAKRSSHTLTSSDLAPVDVQLELDELGQFAELAHGTLSPDFIWSNISQLSMPGFPLDGYHALTDSVLVATFYGAIANLQGYTAYRPTTRQLIVAFSGTSSVGQTLRNLDVRLVSYPGSDECAVHSGFWQLYQGIRSRALEELEGALRSRTVDELVLTGHSLGAAMCYLFALDIIGVTGNVPETQLPLTLALFGCPRIGNMALAERWRTLVADRIARGLPVRELSVKAYNDGVPSIPPYNLGYRHFAQTPLYFTHDHLYLTSSTESECSFFPVEMNGSEAQIVEYPLGGHNYYNGRDMEKLQRNMRWFDPTWPTNVDWEQYRQWLQKEQERQI